MTHIGNGKLVTPSHNFKLDNILCVPQLASNLLSVHKLCLQNNASCYFDAYKFSIQDLPTRKIIYKGLSKDGVYPNPPLSTLSSSPVSSTGFFAVSDQALLWHKRPGHPCSKILHFALFNFKSVHVPVNNDICLQCPACISAKMHKISVPKHVSDSTFPLELIGQGTLLTRALLQ